MLYGGVWNKSESIVAVRENSFTNKKKDLAEIAEVLFVLGTDAGTGWMGLVPGFSIHDELRILTENGFTPYEAIKTGTVNAAIVVEEMNGDGDFGTIEIGKRADLILVEDNPLEDVANIKNILGVMASGRWYNKTMLQKFIDWWE